MKILLLGEYSRLHNTLKEGLVSLGHTVVLVGTGDSFKRFPSDIDVSSSLQNNWFTKKFIVGLYKLSGFDLSKKDIYRNLNSILPQLTNFDVVQLINEDAFGIYPADEIRFYRRVFSQNDKIFLSGCGEDTYIIDYYNRKKMRYSILTPFFNNAKLVDAYKYSFKYLTPPYKKLHQFVRNSIRAVIPSDMDYAIPYATYDKAVAMIPNPINIDKITYSKLVITDKVNIFFGVNLFSFHKKGSGIVLEVLQRIEKEFPEHVNIVIAKNLPYKAYMDKYQSAHIFIDQLYSFDQGFNALEAMARGKCVITGAEREFEAYYQLKNTVAVNALPDADDLFQKIANLIKNKEKIVVYSLLMHQPPCFAQNLIAMAVQMTY